MQLFWQKLWFGLDYEDGQHFVQDYNFRTSKFTEITTTKDVIIIGVGPDWIKITKRNKSYSDGVMPTC